MSAIKLKKTFLTTFNFIKETIQDYNKKNGSLISAAITYYVFLSFFPVLVLIIGTTALFIRSVECAQSLVLSVIKDLSPIFLKYTNTINELVYEVVKGSKTAVFFSFLFLIWSVSSILSNIEKAVNQAWNVTEKRGFIANRIVTLIGIFVLFLFLILSLILTTILELLNSHIIKYQWFSNFDFLFLKSTVGIIIPLFISTGAFTLLYKYMPKTTVPLKAALYGGMFVGLVWEILKFFYSIYASYFTQISRIYGSLAGAVFLLVWIYWMSVIAVFGASLSSRLAEVIKTKK